MVVPNGPGPDITNVSCVPKVTFIVHGFLLVKVVDPTVADAPPAGIVYVAEVDVEEVGIADSLIMTEAAAASPLAPRQSAPEIRLTVPVRVMVSVVSCVASCANMADRPNADAVISINNRFIVIVVAPFACAAA
jgi:hypothetical protein